MDRATVPNDYPALQKVFPKEVGRHHELNGIFLNGMHKAGQRAYIWHVNRLVQRLYDEDPSSANQMIEKFRVQYASTLAELEVFFTLSVNGFSPQFVPESKAVKKRTPDITTNCDPRFVVEVTTARPKPNHVKRNEFIESFYRQMRPRLESRKLAHAIDVRELNTPDVQNLAHRIAEKIDLREGMFVIGLDETVRQVEDELLVDLVDADDAICVVQITSGLALTSLHAENVLGTSLENAVRGKLRRHQHDADAKRVLLVDLTPASCQLMGAGFRASIGLVRKLVSARSSLAAAVLRCTYFPGETGVCRQSSVAWCGDDDDLREQVAHAFEEEGELPDHLS